MRRSAIVGKISGVYPALTREDAEDAHAQLAADGALERFKTEPGTCVEERARAAERYIVGCGFRMAGHLRRKRDGYAWQGGAREVPTEPEKLAELAGASDQSEAREAVRELVAHVKRLPERDRTMFVDFHLNERRMAEIASRSNLSERWVRKRLGVCRTRLGALMRRPGYVPLFIYKLVWRAHDTLAPAATGVAGRGEAVGMPIAKLCAVGCAALVAGGTPVAVDAVKRAADTGKGKAGHERSQAGAGTPDALGRPLTSGPGAIQPSQPATQQPASSSEPSAPKDKPQAQSDSGSAKPGVEADLGPENSGEPLGASGDGSGTAAESSSGSRSKSKTRPPQGGGQEFDPHGERF